MTDTRTSAHHRHPELVSGSIGRFVFPKRGKPQPHGKISPMRVFVQNQVNFPRAMPVFELFLSPDRRIHFAKYFKMNQPIDLIFGGEPGRYSITMLPNSRDQVGRDANVERAKRLARKDIDARLFFLSHARSLAARWTLKQVQGDGIWGKEADYQTHRHPELVSA